MTRKQMDMYMNGTTDKMVAEAHEYEAEQFNKAFMDGRESAWKKYRASVRRKVNEINKITGIGLIADQMMR